MSLQRNHKTQCVYVGGWGVICVTVSDVYPSILADVVFF